MQSADPSRFEASRAALVRRRVALREAVDAAVLARQAVPAAIVGEVDDLKDLAERHAAAELADAAERLTRAALADVEAALRRLVEGRYGDCADCGEPIDAQRLRVLPTALRCARCQANRETARDRRSRRPHPT